MKKTLKLVALLIALVMVFAVVLAACKDTTDPNGTNNEAFMELEDYKAYLSAELEITKEKIGDINPTVNAAVNAAYAAGVVAIEAGTNTATVRAAYDEAKANIAACVPLADGVFDYTTLTNEQRTEILGLLEAYGYHTGSTGIPLYGRGGYVIYRDRVTLGAETYIPGYGFGVLAEGNITAPLATEANKAWEMYYHTFSSQDDGTANYLNSELESVGSTYSYISASYWTNFMNSQKNGYDWAPELAVGDPVALNANSSGLATKWKVEVRSGLKYSTLSKDPARAAFNDREIQMEDYLTPFKLLLNQDNGYFRGTEMANDTSGSRIPGVKEYYNATAGKGQGILDESTVSFENVGISIKDEGGKWYLYYEFAQGVTLFNARYYFNSSLYMPIPADFIKLVGVDNYLGFSSDTQYSPVDNSLSLGAYTLEEWDSNQQIVYKKNPNYVHAEDHYKIQGVHINILEAAKEDREAGIKEYEAGKIDACSIPSTRLKDYIGNPLVRTTADDAVFKLNVNALDQETWIQLFGENGTVAPHSRDQYRKVIPALSNDHFRQALSYALNREEYASDLGIIASANFFSSDYMSDPENNISYNMTDAHKKAVADLLRGAEDTYGYSLELAREYFRMALDELEASGTYKRGTKANPTVITIETIWQAASQEEQDFKYVKQYWEAAFNHESVSGGCYKLELTFWAPNDYNETYDRLKKGEFDIGFGSIGGSSLDPLGFMYTCSSDPSINLGWALNWGTDTNNVNSDLLIYNGMRWSYDALFKATQEPSIVVDGELSLAIIMGDIEVNNGTEAGTTKIDVTVSWHPDVEPNWEELFDLVLFGYVNGRYDEYSLFEKEEEGSDVTISVVLDEANHTATYTIVIANTLLEAFDADDTLGIDLYLGYDIPSAEVTGRSAGYIGSWYLQ